MHFLDYIAYYLFIQRDIVARFLAERLSYLAVLPLFLNCVYTLLPIKDNFRESLHVSDHTLMF